MSLTTTDTLISNMGYYNNLISGDNFTYNNGEITIKNIGKYKITYGLHQLCKRKKWC